MATFLSEIKTVNHSSEKLSGFLTNLNNFKELLPPQIKNWQSTETWCSFDIEGTASLGFQIIEQTQEKIKYENYGKSPFPFFLTINLEKLSEGETRVGMKFEASLNPMMKMMIQKPIVNLLNLMVDKLNELNL